MPATPSCTRHDARMEPSHHPRTSDTTSPGTGLNALSVSRRPHFGGGRLFGKLRIVPLPWPVRSPHVRCRRPPGAGTGPAPPGARACQTNGVTGGVEVSFCCESRPSKVMSKALRAVFHRRGPAFASRAGGVEAHDRHVDAFQGRGLLVGEVAAGPDSPADAGVDTTRWRWWSRRSGGSRCRRSGTARTPPTRCPRAG